MGTIYLTKEMFEQKVFDTTSPIADRKYLGNKPCIIDFFATWCGPCKQLGPVLEELSIEYSDKIYIYKVDVDSQEELSTMFDIRSVPTLFFFPMNGKPFNILGAATKSSLKKKIEELL